MTGNTFLTLVVPWSSSRPGVAVKTFLVGE